MRYRKTELAVVLAVVAAVVAYSQTGLWQGTSGSPSPAPLAATATASTNVEHRRSAPPPVGIDTPEPIQTGEATLLWRSLHDEAEAALGQGDNERAEARLIGALKVAPMAGPIALRLTLDNLGLVCYRLGEYQRSADYQARAIEGLAKPLSLGDPATLGVYETRYALALQGLEKNAEALEALSRACQAFDVAYPAGSPAHSEAMNRLAAQHRSLGDNQGAARLLDER